MSKDMVDEKSSVIKKNLLELNILNNGNSIAAFSSFQNEPQTEELINYLWSEEKRSLPSCYAQRFLEIL